jgi:hypothetical protein
MTSDELRYWVACTAVMLIPVSCGQSYDSREGAALTGGARQTIDDADDGDDEGDGSASWGSASPGSATAVGASTGPDASVSVSASSSDDGGTVIVVGGGSADAAARGQCVHGKVGGDGSYVVDTKACFADTQCRDGSRGTWDRCLHTADARGVCGHRYSAGDIARFDATACSTAATCDDGDAVTEDFCARAEQIVTQL